MNQALSTVAKIAQAGVRNDDDLVDRLNHRYTVLVLVIFTVLVSTTQYVGNPIHCWCPATFTSNHEKFSNYICWITNTYYHQDPNVLPGPAKKNFKYIAYYQWVPVALLVQALLFYLPCLFWRVFSDRSGINVNNLVEAAETIQNALYPERREKTIRYMIRHLDHYLDYQRDYRGGCCDGIRQCLYNHTPLPICGNRRGNYLVALYMSAKILYIINVVGQIFLLNLFLGGDFHMYGVKVVRNLAASPGTAGDRDRDREARSIFPRVTWCDFNIHQVGTVHTHTVQCVLPINFFNEKIYLFLWFWLAFVATATTLSFLRWLWVVVVVHSRNRYVRKHLKIMDRLKPGCDRDRKLSYKFAERYLRQDGVFVLKLVAKNSTDLVVADIVAALWDNYRNKPVQTPAIVERIEIDSADPTSPDML